MGIETTNGLVLHKTNYSNTSLIVTALTPDYGIIRMIGKGFRKPPVRSFVMREPIETFGEMEFVYYRSTSDLHYLSSCAVTESFNQLRTSVQRFIAAGFGASLAWACSGGAGSAEYTNLRNYWSALCRDQPLCGTVLKFWLKHLNTAGFLPSLLECSECGMEMSAASWVIHGEDGLFCDKCKPPDSRPGPNLGELRSAQHLLSEPYLSAKLKLGHTTRGALLSYLEMLTAAQLGRPPRLLDRIRKICDNP